MYDAIIVGARCAGSPTAMLLARKGYRVLLVDRATFPSDVVNGYYVQQTGAARLKRWGLLDTLRASNCPPLFTLTFDFGAFTLTGSPPPVGDVVEGYAPRRTVLDKILVDAAVKAGVELREGFAVQDLLWAGDRVAGIRGHTQGGATVTEHARVVIGADGDAPFPIERSSQVLADKLPDARLVIVNDSGHLPHVEKPEIVNEAIWKWLEDKIHS